MNWQKYQENVDKFFENVDNDILETERVLNNMPSKFICFLQLGHSFSLFILLIYFITD